MGNGKHSRRAFLRKAAGGGAGAVLGGDLFRRVSDIWVAKAEHGDGMLNLHEMLTLAAIAAQIIPTDETPGAREAGIVDYIDSKIKTAEASCKAYHAGLQEIDDVSKARLGALFVKLPFEQQKDILKSAGKSEFFERLRKDTIEAFCRSPVGQKLMGYPGAAQPHGYRNMADVPAAHH